ncbi:2OG-Fe(II) oxygenase [Myxococcaceae bacterium JPH2]|nr:2OG-Fe(II) oxygenase [Myxococcaceae bacterium JPH2]
MSEPWNRVVYEVDGTNLGTAPLRGLVTGDHAVIVLKGLLSKEVMAANKERLLPLRHSAQVTRYVNGSLTLIGLFLVKYLSRLDDYFKDAKAQDDKIAALGIDLAGQARKRIRETFGMRRFEVATEPDGRPYASSNVRICSNDIDTPLHNDNIMRDGKSYPIALANLKHQLSCVVCLQECDEGGELSIYRKPWEPGDEVHKIPGGLGYDLNVVANKAHHRFKPQSGDVYLLNPTYYHAVERVSGSSDRVTLGFFFGFYDDSLTEGVTWV